ncbi:NAD(P)H-dependent oxidoreductase [Sphingomonas sp. UNC305MFCol5.2]|uniref:NAD(P)H-dependent oxidoreductase n=1 Tax=Sphingomonas sp. UNC305MFCol5.2 TaxID=1449076 RepID=UPI00041442E2|nr:NAD(P)H-dependent oxidoreductase [Sphingomonas sp. UNC305MFCol5.2]
MSSETPIRHLIVLGHPGPEGFSHSVAAAYGEAVRACGQQPVMRDLYALDFDPRLKAAERSAAGKGIPGDDARIELEQLRDCAVVALVYPIWFGMPPAIIKGYVDRVLGSGFAARNLMEGTPSDLLHGKRLILFTSSASTKPWLEEQGQWLALRQAFDVYLETIFGFSSVEHVHFDAVVEGARERYVDECLARVDEVVHGLCAELLHERRHARFERHRALHD